MNYIYIDLNYQLLLSAPFDMTNKKVLHKKSVTTTFCITGNIIQFICHVIDFNQKEYCII